MDLSPFTRINPCGYQGLEMIQVSDLAGPIKIEVIERKLVEELATILGYDQVEFQTQALNEINNNEKYEA